MMKSTAIACLAAWTVLGAGCADGTAIATGNRHPPALAANVTLYSAPPGRGYEVVGLVRAESDAGLTAQSSMEYAIEELKKHAASLGANGVLLTGSGVRAVGMNTTYNRQSHTASSSVEEVQHLEGQAIVVR